jgi:hypothetical protein
MKRFLIRLGLALVSLCVVGVLAYYGYDHWRIYKIFRDNFAMSFRSIHRLKGYEWSWLDYTAWVTFVSDGPPVLKHPADYKEVPCRFESIPNENPFFDRPYLREKDHKERFQQYLEFRKQVEATLPDYRCKEGRTNFWITPYGKTESDPSWLIYRTRDGQVLFRVGHLN